MPLGGLSFSLGLGFCLVFESSNPKVSMPPLGTSLCRRLSKEEGWHSLDPKHFLTFCRLSPVLCLRDGSVS